jgi:hypothetical protein
MHCPNGFPLCVGEYFSSDQFSRSLSGLKFFSAIVNVGRLMVMFRATAPRNDQHPTPEFQALSHLRSLREAVDKQCAKYSRSAIQ